MDTPRPNSVEEDRSPESELIAEIEALHVFFEKWLGDAPDEVDYSHLGRALAPGFTLITPRGDVLEREALLQSLESARGGRPGLRIGIEDARLVASAPTIAVMHYVEMQSTGESSETTRRWSTAVFVREESTQGWRWSRVHETWCG